MVVTVNRSPQSSTDSRKMSKCKEARRYLPAAVAWILLLCTTSLFFIFPAQWYYQKYSIWILIGEALIALVVIANFTLATFMDPGIIPKATRGEDDNDDLRAPLYKTVDVQGITVRMKWCVTCQFYRPPRCSHCSVCNNCIETFDHHCPWVNNCIGRRNYRFFFMFLMSLSVHMILIFALCLIYLLQHLEKMSDLRTIISISIMVVIVILCVPICGLTGFHIVLVSRGRTTNEQVTGKYRGGYNPFSRGCCYNCWFTLCGPLYPGLVRAKKNYAQNMAIVYHTSGQRDGPNFHANSGAGNQVKVYVDSRTGKSKSGNISLPSLHSPRDYRQMVPARDNGEQELSLQASQSMDCEPTPPMQRQGSKNNFFGQKAAEDASGLNHVRNVRGPYSHGSPHPNRQSRSTENRSRTPDSMTSPTEGGNPNGQPSFSSPCLHQKIRAIGGVPTPFTSASPIVRRSNPPTPTHSAPSRDFPPAIYPSPIGVSQFPNPGESNLSAELYDPHIDARRFLSESELQYQQRQFPGHLTRGRDSSGQIRELASSPSRGVYTWKEPNSPMGSPLENGNYSNSSYYGQQSNPASPLTHGVYSGNGRGGYYSDIYCPPPYLLETQQKPLYDQSRPTQRPLGFVRALEMSESMESSERGRQLRNSPGGTPKGATQSPLTDNPPDRASVYDMNYEISV